MSIEKAEGYAILGMWSEAAQMLQELTPEERNRPGALVIRARICAMSGDWGSGLIAAMMLRRGDETCRQAASLFFRELAVHHVRKADIAQARTAVMIAWKTWPDYRRAILEDQRLAPIF